MKQRYLHLIILYIVMLTSCTYNEEQTMYDVTVALTAQQDVSEEILVNIPITMTDGNATKTTVMADADGKARFSLPAGVYNISTSAVVENDEEMFIINGNVAQFIVSSSTMNHENGTININTPLTITKKGAHGIIIKELYVGGCQKDNGSGTFAYDKCIILYNNSPYDTEVANLAIGMCEPYNAEASGHQFLNGGVLEYEALGITPAINGIWYFKEPLQLKAYEEVVVNINGAIDNTQTYSLSVNYADSRYYCMYDPEATSNDGSRYNNQNYYPAPSEVIPTDHYLKAVKYGKGNAWPVSNTSPALFIFQTKDCTPKEYADNIQNIIYPSTKKGDNVYACLSVPNEWILDGVEVYNEDKLSACKKRLTPDIDNGYIAFKNGHGKSLVRRIDEAASAKYGHAVYVDTNNSTSDFIVVDECTIKTINNE